MDLSVKNIMAAFFVIIVVGVVGWWGSNAILDLSHQYGWDMFVSQEEIKNQKDSKEIFSDMLIQVHDCLMDEDSGCVCIDEEFSFPSEYLIELEQEGLSTKISLKSSRIDLAEERINFVPCALIDKDSSFVEISDKISLIYGSNSLTLNNYEGGFDPSLIFYKLSDDKICVMSIAVSREKGDLSLVCSEKNERFGSFSEAVNSYDSGLDSSSLNSLISLASLNSNFVSNAEKVMEGIIYIESYTGGKFINREILYNSNSEVYVEGKGNGISMLEIKGSKSAYSVLESSEGKSLMNLYGYGGVDFDDSSLAAVLVNNNELSIAFGYLYLIGSTNSFSNIESTKEIFNIWLNDYHKFSISYSEYVDKMNILNNNANLIGVSSSQILEEGNNPHII
ncbi:hypothetical protein HOA59_01695 [archaeon]|nr:hypothetical protein [archaeon]